MNLLGIQNGKKSLLTTSVQQSIIKGTQNQILINGLYNTEIASLLGVSQVIFSLPQSISKQSIPQFNNMLINSGQNLEDKSDTQLLNYYVVRQDRKITINNGNLISISQNNEQKLITDLSYTINHNTIEPEVDLTCQNSYVLQGLIQDGYGHTINIQSIDVRTLFSNDRNTAIDYDQTIGEFSLRINGLNLKFDQRLEDENYRLLNTIQNIDITATPKFQGLILQKNDLTIKQIIDNNIFSIIVQFQN